MVALENGELLAVLPGAAVERNGERWFRSHPGSTFGGPVLSPRLNQAEKLIELLRALDEHLAARYDACVLKPTPDLFAREPSDLLQYALFYLGYAQETELSAYVPLAGRTHEELLAAYSATKRYELKRCLARGLTDAPVADAATRAEFHALLCRNLLKFDAKPVHTLPELEMLAAERLRDEMRFLGARDAEGKLVAGACLFHFAGTDVLHTQYLATDPAERAYAPSAYLYDQALRYGLQCGARALSFGTSTFERGRVLNAGLIRNKEGYGCRHGLNRIFTKRYR